MLQAPTPLAMLAGAELRFTLANDAFCRMFHYRVIAGKTFSDAFPELAEQGHDKILERVYLTGEPYASKEMAAIVAPADTGKAETFYYNVIYTPYRQSDNKISAVMCAFHDVTDLVIAKRQLQVSEEKSQIAIDLAALGTYEICYANNEIQVNERFKEITGLSADATREDYVSLLHPDDRPARDAAHRESLVTGQLRYEARLRRPAGDQIWILVRGKVLFGERREPCVLIGVIQDITSHKYAARALEQEVEKRTMALNAVNLELQRSNEELEQFAYVTSHDLQEPLRKIKVYHDLVLSRYSLEGEAKRYLEKANVAALRLTGLIRDLLNYSRVAHQPGAFGITDLNKVISNIVGDYELLIEQKGARIEVATLMPIPANELQMHQLFYNLLGNALKFSRKGITPLITISGNELDKEEQQSLPSLSSAKRYYKVEVKDNGIGFNQEYAEKIFSIFQTLNDRSTFGGYGIGLALCKKIVERHAGVIYARGVEDGGACFTVILPTN